MLSGLPGSCLASLEWTLNSLLDLDPQTRERLAAHAGCCLEMRLPGSALALRLFLEDGGRLRLGKATAEGKADLYLEVAPSALLLSWLRAHGGNGAESPFPEQLQVSGDARLLSDLAAALRDFQPDLEGAVARRIGDGPTLQLLHSGLLLVGWLREALAKVARDGADQLRHEHGLLPTFPEVRSFLNEADRLRDAVERLRLRIEGLERRSSTVASVS